MGPPLLNCGISVLPIELLHCLPDGSSWLPADHVVLAAGQLHSEKRDFPTFRRVARSSGAFDRSLVSISLVLNRCLCSSLIKLGNQKGRIEFS